MDANPLAQTVETSSLSSPEVTRPSRLSNFKKTFESSAWAFNTCTERSKFSAPVLLVTQLLKQLQPIASISVLGFLISRLTEMALGGDKDILHLLPAFILFSGYHLFFTLITFLSETSSSKSKFNNDVSLKSNFSKQLLAKGNSFYTEIFGEAETTATFSKTELIHKQFLLFVATYSNLLTVLVVALVLGYFAPILPFIMIPLAIPHFLLELKYRSAHFEQADKADKHIQLVKKANGIYLSPNSLKTFSVLGAAETVDAGYADTMRQFQEESNLIRNKWQRAQKALSAVNSIATIAMYAIVLLQSTALLNVGSIYIQLMFINLFRDKVNATISDYFALNSSAEFIMKIKKFLSSDLNEAENSLLTKDTPAEIKFENITFTPVSGQKSIENINLDFKTGKTYSVISGNDFILNLFATLASSITAPSEGKILLNKYDVKSLDNKFISSKINYIFGPGAYLSFLTIKDNFTMSDASPFNIERANKFAQLTGLYKLFEKRGVNWDTKLATLPKGEQPNVIDLAFLLLTKALYQQNKIIIFNLNAFKIPSRYESHIVKLLSQQKENSGAIVLTKLVTTCVLTDQIILVQNGKVAEMGSFPELINLKGDFAKAYFKILELQKQSQGLTQLKPLELQNTSSEKTETA